MISINVKQYEWFVQNFTLFMENYSKKISWQTIKEFKNTSCTKPLDRHTDIKNQHMNLNNGDRLLITKQK